MSHVRLARPPAHLHSQQCTVITSRYGANLIKSRGVSGCLLSYAKPWLHAENVTVESVDILEIGWLVS